MTDAPAANRVPAWPWRSIPPVPASSSTRYDRPPPSGRSRPAHETAAWHPASRPTQEAIPWPGRVHHPRYCRCCRALPRSTAFRVARSGIVDMQERPPTRAVADQWHAAVAYLLDHRTIQHPGAESVKRSIAQNDAFRARRTGYGSLEIADRRQGPTQLRWRIPIQLIVFGFNGDANARIWPAAIALGDETFDARFARGSQQMIGSTRAQPVAAGERSIEMPEVCRATEIGHFMNDDLRRGGKHRRTNRRGIETVGHHGFRTHFPDGFSFRSGAGEAYHRMTRQRPRRERADGPRHLWRLQQRFSCRAPSIRCNCAAGKSGKYDFKRANMAVIKTDGNAGCYEPAGTAFSAATANRMAISERIRFMKMRQNQPVPYAHWNDAFESTSVPPSTEGVRTTSAP